MDAEEDTNGRLAFDRKKWDDEKALRARELDLKERERDQANEELRLKKLELDRSKLTNPLTVAVIAAALAGAANAWVAHDNGNLQRDLEGKKDGNDRLLESNKAEFARITEVIKFGDSSKITAGLQLLLDLGLIEDPVRASLIRTALAQREPGQADSSKANRKSIIITNPRVQGNPIDICSSAITGNDCSASGQLLAATKACVQLGFKSATSYNVAGYQGTALHWDVTKYQLLPSGAIFSSVECST